VRVRMLSSFRRRVWFGCGAASTEPCGCGAASTEPCGCGAASTEPCGWMPGPLRRPAASPTWPLSDLGPIVGRDAGGEQVPPPETEKSVSMREGYLQHVRVGRAAYPFLQHIEHHEH
jgi:hypothetical protein